ncbi:MAG: Aminopeptidase, partial [Actinomycetota bacterium]
LHKHAWGNATLADLLTELEASSGRDLKAWTKDWLQTPGVNTVRPEIVIAADGTYESVTVVQEPAKDPAGLPAVLRDHVMGIGRYSKDASGNLVRTGFDVVNIGGDRTLIEALKGQPAADLLLLNDGDYTFTKIRLDEASAKTATTSLGRITDPLARALLWSACWDMTRDAQLSMGDYLTLVESALPYETNESAIEAALRNLATGIATYSAPENRNGYRDRFVALLRASIDKAPAGSSTQLQVVKAYASAVRTKEQGQYVRDLFDGTVTLEGRPVDTELGWHFLAALAALDMVSDAEIDAYLEKDPTSNGQEAALTARTRKPNAAAKAAAWDAIYNDEKVTNSAVRAYLTGFWHIDQLDILRPYVDKYFAEIEGVFVKRAESVAMVTSVGTFPSIFVEQSVLEKVTAFGKKDLHTALKRYTAENRDRLERAMRCQAKDADKVLANA